MGNPEDRFCRVKAHVISTKISCVGPYDVGYFSVYRGSVHNIKTMPYFDLVFKLVKTMLEHYSKKR